MSSSHTTGGYSEESSRELHSYPSNTTIELRTSTVVRVLFVITLFGAGVLILRELASFFVTLLVASFLAVAADPVVRAMERRGMGRTGAVLTLLLTILVAFALILLVFVPPVVEQGNRLKDKAPQYLEDVQDSALLQRLDKEYDVVDKATAQLESLPGEVGTQLGSWVGALASGVFGTITVVFMMVLLLLGGGQLVRGTVRVFPRMGEPHYWSLLQGAYTNISAYVGGTLLVATSAGVTMVISLLILGLPFAGPLGLWMFLFGIIPLVGATIGAVPAIIVAFVAEDGGTAKGLILIAIVIAYQQLENLVIQPAIQGRVVNLPPIVIFLSVLIGSQLLGVLGALVAVPMAGIIQIFIKQILDARDDQAPTDLPPIGPKAPDAPVIDTQA